MPVQVDPKLYKSSVRFNKRYDAIQSAQNTAYTPSDAVPLSTDPAFKAAAFEKRLRAIADGNTDAESSSLESLAGSSQTHAIIQLASQLELSKAKPTEASQTDLVPV